MQKRVLFFFFAFLSQTISGPLYYWAKLKREWSKNEMKDEHEHFFGAVIIRSQKRKEAENKWKEEGNCVLCWGYSGILYMELDRWSLRVEFHTEQAHWMSSSQRHTTNCERKLEGLRIRIWRMNTKYKAQRNTQNILDSIPVKVLSFHEGLIIC